MHCQLAGEIAAFGVLDHVDFTDQVGDRHVGSGQLFVIALFAANPGDRGRVPLLGHQVPGVFRDRMIGMVIELGSGDHRQELVQKMHELPQHPRLGLAPQTQEEHVMPRENGVLDLGEDGLFVTEDVWKKRFTGPELADQVASHHRLDPVAARTQFAQSSGPIPPHRVPASPMNFNAEKPPR